MPPNWSKILPANKKIVIFSKILINEESMSPYFERSISVDEDLVIEYRYLNKVFKNEILLEQLNFTKSLDGIQNLIKKFDSIDMCKGISIPEEHRKYKTKTTCFDVDVCFRHINCSIVNNYEKISKIKSCKYCTKVGYIIQNKKYKHTRQKLHRIHIQVTPSKLEKLKQLRKQSQINIQLKKKIKNRLSELKTNFQVLQNKFKTLQEDSISQQLMQYNIPSNQQLLIKEIVSAAKKKNPKGNRYTEEWIILCMLLHIRSPSSYSFMRENQLLPLPCTRTMRNYLSIIKSSCGFDKKFFDLFAKHLESKKDFQKHGLLIFDEISLRESISVNTTTLK